jgi:hypothetical protein
MTELHLKFAKLLLIGFALHLLGAIILGLGFLAHGSSTPFTMMVALIHSGVGSVRAP